VKSILSRGATSSRAPTLRRNERSLLLCGGDFILSRGATLSRVPTLRSNEKSLLPCGGDFFYEVGVSNKAKRLDLAERI
jgi:hypothetical protein